MPGLPLLHPMDVQLQADLQAAIFLSETRLTLEEATGQVEAEILVAHVLSYYYKKGHLANSWWSDD